MGCASNFNLLHKVVQRWVWSKKWKSLNDIQERSIPLILSKRHDLIIGAPTASGKTEAAFLPACTKLITSPKPGVGVLYISPLKALINDQYRRLEELCRCTGNPLTPWHGDISVSLKNKLKKNTEGILMITPESLEAMLLLQGSWAKNAFRNLQFIIIDEFHYFLGSVRGRQLRSQLSRIEVIINRPVTRIALSATLGDANSATQYLRSPTEGVCCDIIETTFSGNDIKLQLRGYIEYEHKLNQDLEQDHTDIAFRAICNDLFYFLRGKSNLIFANSRGRTEGIAAMLSDLCELNNVPNEFYAHHGSISKYIREDIEERLQKSIPISVACTSTLELGIDIGEIDTIAQVSLPGTVSSLRQRLGRSGRRKQPASMRIFINESELSPKTRLMDSLRIHTFQGIAMVNLLLKNWCETETDDQYSFSTLLQQTLSVIGQYGGARADQLWRLLCCKGPFNMIDAELYSKFLRALGKKSLIHQTRDDMLVLGVMGERLVGNYNFYSAFQTPEEYRLECNGKHIGNMPVDSLVEKNQLIIFTGKYWKVNNVDSQKRIISLEQYQHGKPPTFGGQLNHNIHDKVRAEMNNIYTNRIKPKFLDSVAESLYLEGIDSFYKFGLNKREWVEAGNYLFLFPWKGDKITFTISALLRYSGIDANSFGGIIEIKQCAYNKFKSVVNELMEKPPPSGECLAKNSEVILTEKYDKLIPRDLLEIAYAHKYYDVDGAIAWLKKYWDKKVTKNHIRVPLKS